LKNPFSGRALPRLFKAHQLKDISMELVGIALRYVDIREMLCASEQAALASCAISRAELERWRGSLVQSEARGGIHAHVIMLLVVAHK